MPPLRSFNSDGDKIANALRVLVPQSSTSSSMNLVQQHLQIRSSKKYLGGDSSGRYNLLLFCVFLLQTLLTTGLYVYYHKEGGLADLHVRLQVLGMKLEECSGAPVDMAAIARDAQSLHTLPHGLTSFKRLAPISVASKNPQILTEPIQSRDMTSPSSGSISEGKVRAPRTLAYKIPADLERRISEINEELGVLSVAATELGVSVAASPGGTSSSSTVGAFQLRLEKAAPSARSSTTASPGASASARSATVALAAAARSTLAATRTSAPLTPPGDKGATTTAASSSSFNRTLLRKSCDCGGAATFTPASAAFLPLAPPVGYKRRKARSRFTLVRSGGLGGGGDSHKDHEAYAASAASLGVPWPVVDGSPLALSAAVAPVKGVAALRIRFNSVTSATNSSGSGSGSAALSSPSGSGSGSSSVSSSLLSTDALSTGNTADAETVGASSPSSSSGAGGGNGGGNGGSNGGGDVRLPSSEYLSVCSVNGHEVGTYVLPSDPDYIIGGAAEAVAENPELARKVAAVANERREVLFALANGIMICKNLTTCWWDGGNILEAFLLNLERVGVTNHLIGVLDDETERYLIEREANRTRATDAALHSAIISNNNNSNSIIISNNSNSSSIITSNNNNSNSNGMSANSGSTTTTPPTAISNRGTNESRSKQNASNSNVSGFKIHWTRFSAKDLPAAQKGSREANIVSSLKFTVAQKLMRMGYHTLLSDMDLVYVQNPFDFLHRDSDIESSSDGFDATSYGTMDSIHDPTMGWGGGGLFMKTFTLNVGCAYLRATQRSFALVRRVAHVLATEKGWDQQIFNSELLSLAHGGVEGTHPGGAPSVRVMPLELFVNSKTFFRSRREMYLPGAASRAPLPVVVHFNYHPDKFKRMRCIAQRYFEGKLDACDMFPGGSEPLS